MFFKLHTLFLIAALFSVIACKKNTNDSVSETPELPEEPKTPDAPAGITLRADGPGNTYSLINSVLGGTAYEVPDCAHAQEHISELYDNVLKTNVFVFSIHTSQDNDRCENFDRQRNEIKTYGPSNEKLKATIGETVTYRWKFKIDASFQASPSFCHIHQIKAGDGDDRNPIITITPRYGANNTDKMELIHIGSDNVTHKVKTVDLAPFKGTWVEVTEKMKYATNGTYSVQIKRISDGQTLLSYDNQNIDLWRNGTTFCRPKWGIYRSLNSVSYLRDEDVRFADFCIAEGNAVCQ